MANDYSLDPFQVEEDELEHKRKQAIAQLLRSRNNPAAMDNPAQIFTNRYEDIGSEQMLDEIGGKKRDLASRANASFLDSVSKAGLSPATVAMLKDPQMRATGVIEAGKEVEQKRWEDADARDAAARALRRQSATAGAGTGAGAGGAQTRNFDYEEAVAAARSRNPHTAKRGDAELKLMEPTTPDRSVRGDLYGNFNPIPGADEGKERQEIIKSDQTVEEFMVMGENGLEPRKMTRLEARQQGLMDPRPKAGSTATGGGSAVSAGRIAPTPSGPASDSIPPASGGRGPLAGAVAASGGGGTDKLLPHIPKLEGWDPRNPVNAKTGAAGPFQIMPKNVKALSEVAGMELDPMNPEQAEWMANQVLMDGRRKYGDNDAAVLAHYNGGWAQGDAIARGGQPTNPETRSYVQRGMAALSALNPVGTAQAQSMAQEPYPQALPGAVAAQSQPQARPQVPALPDTVRVQQPTTGLGNKPNISRTKGYEELVKTNIASKQKADETALDHDELLDKMEYFRQENKHPSYSGFMSGAGPWVEETATGVLGGRTTAKYANTKLLSAAIEDYVAPLLKQYGYNPSNRDLAQAKKRIPEIHASPEGREAVAALVVRGLQAEKEVAQLTDNIFNQNNGEISHVQAKREAWKIYNTKRDAEEAAQKQGRPTGGSNAAPAAGPLAASIAAAGTAGAAGVGGPPAAGPPAAAPPGGQSALYKSLKAKQDIEDAKLRKEYGGSWTGQGMWDSAKNLPGALFSRAGAEGLVDAYGNIIEGGMEMVGMGDREKAMVEQARQERRARDDPDYGQAKIFHSVANPATVAAAYFGTTIPRLMAGSGLLAGLHPTETAGGQAINIAKGTGVGAVTGALGKLIPSTGPSKAMRDAGLTPKMVSEGPVDATSAQLNAGTLGSKIAAALGKNEAASLDQSRQVTQFLMGEGKIAGERLTREGVAEAVKRAEDAGRAAITGKIKLPPAQSMELIEAVDELLKINGVTPKGSPLNAFLRGTSTATKTNARAVKSKVTEWDGDKLYDMWKEVAGLNKSKPAQANVWTAMEKLIEAHSPEALAALKQAQQEGRHVANIERVWSSGGGGSTELGTGLIDVSRLKLEAGRGPKDAITDSIMELVNLLNLRNYKPNALGASETAEGLTKSIVKESIGKGLYHLDKWGQKIAGPKAHKAAKFIADRLRNLNQTAPMTATQPFYGSE